MCKMDLSFWYSNCCESTKKLKDPFVKVESICLFVPIVDIKLSIQKVFILNLFAVLMLCNVQILPIRA